MGVADPAAVLLGAQDPETGIIYFYREYYKRDQVLSQVGAAIKDMIKDIPQGTLHMPLIDPSANKRSQIDGKTYKRQMQLQFDLIFKEANNNIEDGIAKTRDMMFNGKVKFFRSLKETIREGCEYRYPTLEERKNNRNLGDKPIDKDNHLMDCLRYICQEIPYDYLDPNRMSFSGVKKFFENMGVNMGGSNRRHSTSFNDVVRVAQSLSIYNGNNTGATKRASGGFKL